jgi:1-acyl-sn-glycerol-3-phosphate acyltransferase
MWTDQYSLLRIIFRGSLLILAALTFLPLTLFCQTPYPASIRVGRRKLDEFMLNTWSRWMSRLFGVRTRVSGAILPGPVLIVANHISWLDIVVMHSAAAMSFVSKAEVKNWPVIGFAATLGGTVYLERGSHDSSTNVAGDLITRLKQGRRVAIFPEGGISPGDSVKVFHARLFKIAVEGECPVQPVMIRYVSKGRRDPDMSFFASESFIANALRLLGRPASICELAFLDPIPSQGHSRKALAEHSRAAVDAAFGEAV